MFGYIIAIYQYSIATSMNEMSPMAIIQPRKQNQVYSFPKQYWDPFHLFTCVVIREHSNIT